MSTVELKSTLEWTFMFECEVPEDVTETLANGEQAVCAYKTIRDVAVFTNKRLIVRDSQGITGQKVETYSLPYKSIVMYSTENSGMLVDWNCEVEIWTLIGQVKIRLGYDVDVRKFDKLISDAIL
ncbi:MAG: PH domain-containing protein [Erysipelotrichaceae bacterium]|nr:PH domain-containing protein [Erysipelotrichaceae bacterium]